MMPLTLFAFLFAGITIAGWLWMFGATRVAGRMFLGLFLILVATNLVPPLWCCMVELFATAVGAVLVILVLVVAIAAGMAVWRYWRHRYELRTWKPRQPLSPKRRVERE